MEFVPFPKMPRLNRQIIITEKIDGTNAQVVIFPYTDEEAAKNGALVSDDKQWIMRVGSRNRYLTHEQDNFGFFTWCRENKEELFGLGEGRHFGEWWGKGIQCGYGMETRKFSLFNVSRWMDLVQHKKLCPPCCDVVPLLYMGLFDEQAIKDQINTLKDNGSWAKPGYAEPEGIIVYHVALAAGFKITLKNDGVPKGAVQ